MRLFRSVLKRLVIIGFVIYLTLFVVLLINQRALIFHPTGLGNATPAKFNVPFDVVHIPVSGRAGLYGWWIHFPDEAVHPTVVYCHGNGAALSSYSKVAQIFYGLGWNALIFDYRGYGASDSPSEGLSEESTAVDADAAYRWATAKVPEASVIIWGHSLGSSVAARLSSHHDPAGLILEGAFPSMYRMALKRYPYFPIFQFMVFDRFTTAEYIENRKFPVLMIHAQNDSVIPLEFGEELYSEALQPKSWLLLSGINHNDFPSVHEQYDSAIGAQVAEWIKLRSNTAVSSTVVTTSLLSR